MSKSYYSVPNPHSAAWRIFHERWNIQIKRLHLMTKAELDMGIHCGKDQGTESIMHENALVWLTLDELALLYADGASFSVVQANDSVEMYKLLLEHLELAASLYNNPLNTRKPPKDDLKMFDALAGQLYMLATQFDVPDSLAGGMTSFIHTLTGRMRLSRGSLFGPEVAERSTDFRYNSPVEKALTQKPITGGRQWQPQLNKP